MGKDEHDELKRRHSEYVDEVFKMMIASLRVGEARSHMWNTKIKCGPDAHVEDETIPMSKLERMRLRIIVPPPPPVPPIKRSKLAGQPEVVEFPTGRKIS